MGLGAGMRAVLLALPACKQKNLGGTEEPPTLSSPRQVPAGEGKFSRSKSRNDEGRAVTEHRFQPACFPPHPLRTHPLPASPQEPPPDRSPTLAELLSRKRVSVFSHYPSL